jgi:hypothetical protein
MNKISNNHETATSQSTLTLAAVKILALEGGGDWADASVDYMVNVSGRTGEELNDEYRNNGGYHGNGERWFKQWAFDMGYCREASDDELEVVSDL